MRGQTFLDRLKQRFGDEITGANLEAIDPWIEVSPEGIDQAIRNGIERAGSGWGAGVALR